MKCKKDKVTIHETILGKEKHAFTLPLDWDGELCMPVDNELEVKEPLGVKEGNKYCRDWSEYNGNQTLELLHVNDYLQHFLGQLPPEIPSGNGRPMASMKDIIHIGVNIQYMGISTRRMYSFTELLSHRGYISCPYHFNTISKYIRDPRLTPMMERLIEITARPMAVFEEMLAVDATGIGKHFFSHWIEDKSIHKEEQQHDYLKLHVIVGAKTGTILSAIVTPSNVNETTQYEQLLLNASKIVEIRKVSADKAYPSRKNIDLTFRLGGIPFIPFKSNSTGKKRGSANWQKAYNFFVEHNDLFMQHYHLRSNVESVFSTIKRVTPRKLMTGSFESQKNEVLLKCLTHNLRVLSCESFVLESLIEHYHDGTGSA